MRHILNQIFDAFTLFMKPSQEALLVDLVKQEDLDWIMPRPPIATSDRAGWNGLYLSYNCQPAHEFPGEFESSYHNIVTTINGRQHWSECRLDGKFRSYFCGDGITKIVPANMSHWAKWDREVEFVSLMLCPQFLQQAADESIKSDRVELIPYFDIDDSLIHQISLALKADIETGNSIGQVYGESLVTTLAVHLLKNYATSTPAIRTYRDRIPKSKLKQATDYIKAHLDQDLSLREIAETLEISQFYLSRLFKQSIGVAPYQYVIQQRVERAKQLLKKQNLPLAEIALQCGFANQCHFTRHFHKHTGVTPKVYQKQ